MVIAEEDAQIMQGQHQEMEWLVTVVTGAHRRRQKSPDKYHSRKHLCLSEYAMTPGRHGHGNLVTELYVVSLH